MVYGGKPQRNPTVNQDATFFPATRVVVHRASGDAGLADAIGGYQQPRAVPPPKDSSLGARCLAEASGGGCAAWGEVDDYASPSSGGGPSLGGAIHLGLDVAGAVPALGEPFDLANCGFYAAEGENVDAGLSCAAAVPLAGWVATGAKTERRIAKATEQVGTAAESRKGARGADEAFHYTKSRFVKSIEKEGLRPGSYVTSRGDLSPLQAQIDLALPPNRKLSNAVVRIDLAGLRTAGYDIDEFTQVGRKFNMPGGGTELRLKRAVPPRFLKVVAR